MTHAVVCWEEENSYSTVSLKDLEFVEGDEQEQIGKSVRIKWKNEVCVAKIIAIGEYKI